MQYCECLYLSHLCKQTCVGHGVYKPPYGEWWIHIPFTCFHLCTHNYSLKTSPYYKGETHLLYAALSAVQQVMGPATGFCHCILWQDMLYDNHCYYDCFEKSVIVGCCEPCCWEAPWLIATQYCTLEEYTDLTDGINLMSLLEQILS